MHLHPHPREQVRAYSREHLKNATIGGGCMAFAFRQAYSNVSSSSQLASIGMSRTTASNARRMEGNRPSASGKFHVFASVLCKFQSGCSDCCNFGTIALHCALFSLSMRIDHLTHGQWVRFVEEAQHQLQKTTANWQWHKYSNLDSVPPITGSLLPMFIYVLSAGVRASFGVGLIVPLFSLFHRFPPRLNGRKLPIYAYSETCTNYDWLNFPSQLETKSSAW